MADRFAPTPDPRPLRVLYLTNAAQIGGGNQSLLVLWRAIRALGVEPIAVCPEPGPMVDACAAASVRCVVRPYPQPEVRAPWALARATLAWRRLLAAERIDLVHANDPTNARSMALAARLSRIPVLCHVHFPPGPGFFEWAFRGLPKPQGFAYCSRALRDDVGPAAARACPASLQEVVYNAITAEAFAGRSPARPPQARLRIGIVANLIPIKGHEDFLAMAALLTGAGVDADYWIIGGDIHGNGLGVQLRERAAALGIADRVTFTGHVSDVPSRLLGLDVVTCCSHVEPFGICVLEGMAARKPVVATKVGGIPEIVVEGVTGYLVDARSPAQMAARVRALAEDADLRATLGTAGRDRVDRVFSDGRQAETTRQLYDRLLNPAATQGTRV